MSHHALATAYAEVTIEAAMMAQPHRVAYHRRLYGCCADLRDDYDVAVRLSREVHVKNCTFDLDLACHHLMTAAMTSASSGWNCEMKDFVKIRMTS